MSTLIECLAKGKVVGRGRKVKLPMDMEGEIYGFVVFSIAPTELLIQSPPLGHAYVVSNRLVFAFGKSVNHLPIFITIQKPACSTCPIYRHFIPQFYFEENIYRRNAYTNCALEEVLDERVLKLKDVKLIEGMPHYILGENDYVFTSHSKLMGIGNEFVVIVRRVAPETGIVVYESYNPIEIELMENKDL